MSFDFSRRAHLSEMMDAPCSDQDLRSCLRDLAAVNRVTFAYRPTLRWLKQFTPFARPEHPLHIVDVGCGGGDMLRRIDRWACSRRLSMRLTGVDVNPDAIRIAGEFTPANSRIEWIVGDACSLDTKMAPADLVISSLFTHHLDSDALVRFLVWMEHTAHRGWFINDLYRSRISYAGFTALSAVARWHRFVRHDGPVSIRRAFLPAEWQQYLEMAGLSIRSVQIEPHWPARLCLSRVKHP